MCFLVEEHRTRKGRCFLLPPSSSTHLHNLHSTRIGNRVVLGGQCGVSDNIFVGDDVVAGGATKIMTKTPAGRVILGYPAMKMDTYVSAARNWRRLPRMMDDIETLKKAVLKDGEDD